MRGAGLGCAKRVSWYVLYMVQGYLAHKKTPLLARFERHGVVQPPPGTLWALTPRALPLWAF